MKDNKRSGESTHICVVSPSFSIGGIERTVSELANYFANHVDKVSFVSMLRSPKFIEIDNSIQILEPSFRRRKNFILKLIDNVRLLSYMRTTFKNLKPDVILSLADYYNSLVIMAALGLRSFVFIGDVVKPGSKFPWPTAVAKRLCYPFSDGFIAQTNAAARFYEKKFGNKLNIKVINGPVKRIKYYEIKREKLIINVGRLSYEKGQDRLIEAFRMLKNTEGWSLAFTASGPMKDRLVNMAKQYNLEDKILFLGKLDDIDRLYAEASIFVLPSREEGFPNSLCEAMAAGIPCICFDSFPSTEIITNNVDGIIIPDGDIRNLADQIDRLIIDDEERVRLGENAKQIAERLNINVIGQKYLEFMMSKVNNR